MDDDIPKVRPLSDEGHRHDHPTPPRLIVLVFILVIGAIVGWSISAFGGDAATEPATTTTDASRAEVSAPDVPDPDPITRVDVDWTAATAVPAFPDGYDYAGATDPVEFEDSIYLVVRFFHTETRESRNELWMTSDGQTWRSEPLGLGESVAVVGLVATADGLILSGTRDGVYTMWRSVPGRSVAGTSWNQIDIEVPDGIEVLYQATVVNNASEVVTTVIGNSDIWRDVIEPYLPAGIDPDDPDLTLSLPGHIYVSGEESSIPVFADQPEVVTTDDAAWVRFFTTRGEEVIEVHDLPPGAYPVEDNPDLGNLRLAFSWFSADGTTFLPVLGGNAVPEGYFLPEPWGDGFVAAGYARENSFAQFEDVRVWRTSSGRAWQPIAPQPPAQCTRFFMASSADRILLSSEDGNHCLGTVDGDWIVLDDVDISSYVRGGPGGFISYPEGFDYDTALFSPDGESWASLQVPAAEPYPTLVPLQDRLFMLSVDPGRPGVPKHIELWLGDIALTPPLPHRNG